MSESEIPQVFQASIFDLNGKFLDATLAPLIQPCVACGKYPSDLHHFCCLSDQFALLVQDNGRSVSPFFSDLQMQAILRALPPA